MGDGETDVAGMVLGAIAVGLGNSIGIRACMLRHKEVRMRTDNIASSRSGDGAESSDENEVIKWASHVYSVTVVVPLYCRYVHYRGKYPHYSDNRHYSAHCYYWLSPYVLCDFKGTIAGNRHYSTGAIRGPLLELKTGGVSKTYDYCNIGHATDQGPEMRIWYVGCVEVFVRPADDACTPTLYTNLPSTRTPVPRQRCQETAGLGAVSPTFRRYHTKPEL